MPRHLPSPARAYTIHDREVFIFDALFSLAEQKRIFGECDDFEYARKHNRKGNVGFSEWAVYLEPRASAGHVVVQRLQPILALCFPGRRFTLVQSYCKNLCYGDAHYPHRDVPSERIATVITTVYYPNLTWSPRWGGETIFYDRHGDAVVCISPRPGRLVLFRGVIPHAAGVPTRNCSRSRYTLVNKFRAIASGRPQPRPDWLQQRLIVSA